MYGPGESRQPMPPGGYGAMPVPGQAGGPPPPGYGADPRQGQPAGPGYGQPAGHAPGGPAGPPAGPGTQRPYQPPHQGQPYQQGPQGQQHQGQPHQQGPTYQQHQAQQQGPQGQQHQGQPHQQGPTYQQHQAQQSGRAARASSGVAGRVLVFAAAAVLVVTGGVNAVSGPLGYLNDVNVGVLVVGGNELFLAVAQTVLGLAWLVAGVVLPTGRRFPWGLAIVSAGVFAVYESFFIVRGSVIHNVGLFLAIVVFVLLHQSAARMYCKVGPPAR